RAKQSPFPFIPEGEGKHAAKMFDAGIAVTIISRENAFGVRARTECPVLFKRCAQLDVIEDFAIIGDAHTVRRAHWLLGCVREVDDREPAMAQADIVVWRRP